MLVVAMAVGAAIVSFAFTLSTLDRWLLRKRPHELAWTLAFAFFTLAAAALAVGARAGWDSFNFRLFYLMGAVVNVPFLALGQILLLRRNKQSTAIIYSVVVFSAFACGVLLATPFRAPLPTEGLVQGSDVFGPLPRILAAVGSGLGALVIVVATAYGVLQRRERRSTIGNLLILLGTLVSGASGLLHSVLGELVAFSVTLTLGVTLIFAGFLVFTSALNSVKSDSAAADDSVTLLAR